MKTRLLSLILLLLTAFNFNAQTTAIPDPNFEQALINLGYDSGSPNGTVPTSNISNIQNLYVSNKQIINFSGIQDFTALKTFDCSEQNATSFPLNSLNLSNNLNLTKLICDHNGSLSTLIFPSNNILNYLDCSSTLVRNFDYSQLPNLTYLNCQNTNSNSLDVSNNIFLTTLISSVNGIINLNVTQNTALQTLECYFNLISDIDLSQNVDLTYLHIGSNKLTSINLSQNILLEYFNCYGNQLNYLDISQNIMLKDLICNNNQITSGLNLSQHVSLRNLKCHNNLLYSLNVKNGNNLNFYTSGGGFDARNNPNLTCIEVDDSTWATTNLSTRVDGIASFSTNCNNNAVSIVLPTLPVCLGDSALIFGNYQSNSGNYYNVMTSVLGYDSIVIQPLITLSPYLNNQNTSICSGDSLLIYGNYQSIAGVYYDSLQTTFGCDSILSTTLTINPVFYSNVNQSIWQGDSTLIYGNYESMAGIYYDSLQTYLGCDSVLSTTLTICSLTSNYSYINNGSGNYTFTNTSTGNYNKNHWAFGDGTISTVANPNHTFSSNGTYVVILTVNDSTVGSSCVDYYIDTIVVTGVPSPLQCVAGFVVYPDTVINNITVVNSSTGSNLTYFWDFGDGNTSTLQTTSHTYSSSGSDESFLLCLTVDDGVGCNNTFCDSIGQYGVVFNKQKGFTINVIAPPIVTGLENNPVMNTLVRIYPNPTSTLLTIDTELVIKEVVVIDIAGQIIKSVVPKANKIDVSNLSNGIYFIKVVGEEQTIIQKFVKQ
ncbi:MAG: T9SS type A sorting domain-containing protein [Bacteroidetes bacterium]|nr:T9SS type A sorting domain-containing protein [Bacteroidota bacterium]